MFDSKEKAQAHRDAVVDVLRAALDGRPWHVHPVLDGAVVRIDQTDLDVATAAIEERGYPIKQMGTSGDWAELMVKPK